MLNKIRIFTSDSVWRQILADFDAGIVDDVMSADVDFDSVALKTPVSPLDLKTAVIQALDDTEILNAVFGRRVNLTPAQRIIVTRLKKSGGMTADELKKILGYAQDATTHAVDTAIYGLRKLFGRDFIINENGIFKIGGV